MVCRMCHVTLERRFSPRDAVEIDRLICPCDPLIAGHSISAILTSPMTVEELHYEHHIRFPYPTHGITDCESCHYEGTYEVPDQTKSLPGLLSASDDS